MLETRNYAARLSADGTRVVRKVKLWEGRTGVPGEMQAVRYRGGPVVTYFRQSSPETGMQFTVHFLNRAAGQAQAAAD